ncbi:MAG: DNA topoisomerase 3 [Desulfobacteraceae bacterium]|nr:DNA topoisomerase 3 [Desulfobacteraceae bacterium]
MKIIIAEKPSVARAIAKVIGNTENKPGYIKCNNETYVTWCVGHLLEQVKPEHYDPDLKTWKKENLPFVPDHWKMEPRNNKGIKKQLNVIKELIKKSDIVVNAGDEGREGQLIVDEVLDYFNCTAQTQRLLLSSLTDAAIQKALDSVKDNNDYISFKDSALARSRADWLIGLNTTRALTVTAQSQGLEGVFSLGRVQTPTLALVVERDQAIKNFKPVNYFIPTITINHSSGDFVASWVASDKYEDLDPENRVLDKKLAHEIASKAKDQHGIVSQVNTERKKKVPPLPFSLSALQQECSKKWGFTAKETLDYAQSLYDKKLTTYPRTDCRFLPEDQFNESEAILNDLMLQKYNSALNADHTLKSKAWNTKKVGEHHGIIPTGETPNSLNTQETHVFNAIVFSYIQQFFPAMHYESTKIISDIADEQWSVSGTTVIDPGWTSVNPKKETKKVITLPEVKENDPVSCKDFDCKSKTTQPLAKFTDGTLIAAMENIHKYVEDKEKKTTLKETSGLGTEATRANIIETLLSRKYLLRDKKFIISTETGKVIIAVSPSLLKDYCTTATWETKLNEIAKKEGTLSDFLNQQKNLLPDIVKETLSAKFPKSLIGDIVKCPECGSAIKRIKSKDKPGFYWACFNNDGHKTNSPLFLPDNNGVPAVIRKGANNQNQKKAKCPDCGKDTFQKESVKKKGFFFWACKSGECPLRKDDNGKPGEVMIFKTNK